MPGTALLGGNQQCLQTQVRVAALLPAAVKNLGDVPREQSTCISQHPVSEDIVIQISVFIFDD